MKTIKATHIDTGGHGYLSVSKKDILAIGIDHNIFSTFSGHNTTRMYLEEDCDATKFMDYCQAKGIKVNVKSGYNPKFNITHNYKPELFNYTPAVNDMFDISSVQYKITEFKKSKIIIRNLITGTVYGISTSNPFKYIEKLS